MANAKATQTFGVHNVELPVPYVYRLIDPICLYWNPHIWWLHRIRLCVKNPTFDVNFQNQVEINLKIRPRVFQCFLVHAISMPSFHPRFRSAKKYHSSSSSSPLSMSSISLRSLKIKAWLAGYHPPFTSMNLRTKLPEQEGIQPAILWLLEGVNGDFEGFSIVRLGFRNFVIFCWVGIGVNWVCTQTKASRCPNFIPPCWFIE